MTRHLLVYPSLVAVGLALAGTAWAQTQITAQQPLSNTGSDTAWASTGTVQTRAPAGQETGVKLSPTSLLHVGIGVEGGYDSNVFYTKANDPDPRNKVIASPLLRVTPFAEITNATRTGAAPSGVYYDLNTSLTYREYLTDDPDAKAQRAFNPSVTGILETSTGQTFTLGVSDTFVRMEDPPYLHSTTHIARDHNIAGLDLRFAPGGGRLRGLVRYTNALDFFEESSGYNFASTMGNEVLADGSWLWLPKTAIFLQVAQGYVHYLGTAAQAAANQKFDSYPLRALAGLRGLLTEKLSAQLGVGYANAFYQGGASTSGLSNLAAFVEITHRPTLLTNLTLGYRHEYRNSVVGSFYDTDSVYLGVGQRIASRVNVLAHGKYEYRRFKGTIAVPGGGAQPLDRQDNFAEVGLAADYFLQDWLYAGVGYLMLFNNSQFGAGASAAVRATGVDYIKHQITFRLGVIF
jgi:hypothetical protein